MIFLNLKAGTLLFVAVYEICCQNKLNYPTDVIFIESRKWLIPGPKIKKALFLWIAFLEVMSG
jgi:hypothetical protein